MIKLAFSEFFYIKMVNC